jgi:hypothetical protein
MERNPDKISTLFFVGGVGTGPDEVDTVVLSVPDDYLHLPAKVRAFFEWALLHSDFEWLFKCDDDTYVALDRLAELLEGPAEIIGSKCLETRGAPSGGAGYFLTRRVVEMLVADRTLPATGDEDLIHGRAAIGYGVEGRSTSRLRMDASQFPKGDNHVVTAHWCSPQRMRAIHCIFSCAPLHSVRVKHPYWNDEILLYQEGFAQRFSTGCCAKWSIPRLGMLQLDWLDWPPEIFVASEMSLMDPNTENVDLPGEHVLTDFAPKLGSPPEGERKEVP